MPKKKIQPSTWLILLAVVVALIVGFYYISGSNKGTSKNSKNNLEQIIKKQDADGFLALFDSDLTESSLSQVGAKSVLSDWDQNATEDVDEVVKTLKDGGRVPGASNNYHIDYQPKRKMYIFKKDGMTTRDSELLMSNKLKAATITVNGKKVSYSELKKHKLFPGEYNFKVILDQAKTSQKIVVLGDGRTKTLKLPKEKSQPAKEDSADTTQENTDTQPDTASTNNDPKYKDATQLTSSDIIGTWYLVDGANDIVGALPEHLTVTATSVSIQRAHNIQNNMNIGSAKYSDAAKAMVFYSSDDENMPNGFTVKLVKKNYEGQERVMLEQDDGDMTGWFIRQ